MNNDLQNSNKRILILGCGWVGEEFAAEMKNEGYEVWVTTTSELKRERLQQRGFHSVLLNFDEEYSEANLPDDFVFVLNSIPATSRNRIFDLENRFLNVKKVLAKLRFEKHIFLSSIGIYPDVDGVYDEGWVLDLDERLVQAERQMNQLDHTLVYRLGGLFGKERVFAKYFAGKICQTGDQPANFIHITDVVNLLRIGFLKLHTGDVFNIVTPEHPTKKDVVMESARKYGFDLPLAFEPIHSYQKIVSGRKIADLLDYSFRYPSPLYF